MNILTRAQEVAKKLNLKESSHGYSFYFQDEISNDEKLPVTHWMPLPKLPEV